MFLDWQPPQPQRRVLVVFLGLAVVFTGVLSWLGWPLLAQDRSLERQRVQERLEQAADHVTGALQRALAELDAHLPDGSNAAEIAPFQSRPVTPGPGLPEDVAVLRATERGVRVVPPGRLFYYPALDDVREPPASTFAAGEKLEYDAGDPVKAAEAFQALAQSTNRETRAGALLRLARNLRKAGRNPEALHAYDDLAQLGAVRVAGLPAELVAREARCRVFEALGNRQALRREAAAINVGLRSGRWSLLRSAWEFHLEEAQRWSASGSLSEFEKTEADKNTLALSSAAEWIYQEWRARPASKGHRILDLEGRPVLISWIARRLVRQRSLDQAGAAPLSR